MEKEDNIIVPRWFLENIENTLRIQNNINLDKKTGETCQDRNIKESLNGDLFIITSEPELSEFEKKLVEMLMEATGKPESSIKIDALKETASELLELARKELEGDLKEKVIHDYWKQASVQCAQAREEGRKEAEKNLIPLINRLCEAILFDWKDKAELAWKIQSKIKEETK